MEITEKNFYDRYYYLTSCGIRYDDKKKWEEFFGGIADRIVREINPKTVLDAGCAYGYLVAALRDLGVKAYGIDISEYAISQVREDIKPFCKVGSVMEPLASNYDLIISIEVLEHLQPHEGIQAIENLCRYTSDFLFTSTPADLREATHFNVQPTDYWARLFANCSFYRDVDFDASFIIVHAIRFRKLADTIASIIAGYEKNYYRYYTENKILREELISSRAAIAQRFNENESPLLEEKNQIIEGKDIHITNQDILLQDRDAYIANQHEKITNLAVQLEEKNKTMQGFTERLFQLDIQHLKQVEANTREQHTAMLNATLNEKNNAIEQRIAELAANIDALKQEISGKDVHKVSLQEPTDINGELKEKLRGTYLLKEENEKIIHRLRAESDNLRLEVNQLKQYNDAMLLPYKSAHLELERIRQLKGYRILWKYYEIRDKLFSRNSALPPATASPVLLPNDTAAASTAIESETILEKERKYYSQNPVYTVNFGFTPLISIIVPVYNTPADVLEEMILSVTYQTYAHWELHLLDAGVENREIVTCIQKYTNNDNRILYKKIDNAGIAANTNAGIALAHGEFIAFLDHDDTLAPHALFEIVAKLQDEKNTYDFFYSDKNMLQEDGKAICNPLYKPHWSPEMMFSANYLTHFCVIRKTLIEASGLLDSATDGAQDWDIFLKVSRLTNKICHIPAVLYHWRIIQTSVSSGIAAKPYALNAQVIALQHHLNALHYNATVKFHDQEKSILKIEWNNTGIEKISFIINHGGTDSQLHALLGQITQFTAFYKHAADATVLTGPHADNLPDIQVNSFRNAKIVARQSENIYEDLNRIIQEDVGDILVVLDSQICFESINGIHELISWAAQRQYGAISPQLKDNNNVILSSGIVINNNYVLDVFRNVTSGHYTIFGHTDWYRNVTAVHKECFAVKTSLLRDNGFFQADYDEYSCIEFCLRLIKSGYRHVYNPFVKIKIGQLADLNDSGTPQHLTRLKEKYALRACDPYWNPHLLANQGAPAENKRKTVILPSGNIVKPIVTGWEKYSSDAFYLAHEFDFSSEEFKKNQDTVHSNKGNLDIKTVNWILPDFDFIYYAGLYTIFRLANYLQSVETVQNTIVIIGGNNEKQIYDTIVEAFPLMRGCRVICLSGPQDIHKIPYADASICSLWTTAYYLLRFQHTKRKFYFIQDFEPLFYPAGSTYGQTETTYKFGFYGITNTQGLRKIYEEQYNAKAIDLKPCIDSAVFNTKNMPVKGTVKNVFFYSRPGHPRNGFELGSTALKILKNRLKDKVRIYCAGSDWDPADYGLKDIVHNMGRMDFEKTADLYKLCDAGLVMMFTKHPSYLPFELMACGCAVISNHNNHTTWFLKDGVNCLLTEATATQIAATIEKLLTDDELRNRLSQTAEKNILANHAEWDNELSKIYRFMCFPDGA